jgi:hypothetical protein
MTAVIGEAELQSITRSAIRDFKQRLLTLLSFLLTTSSLHRYENLCVGSSEFLIGIVMHSRGTSYVSRVAPCDVGKVELMIAQ